MPLIAVAVLGLTLRRIKGDHHFHGHLHDFSEAIGHALTAVFLIGLVMDRSSNERGGPAKSGG